MTTHTSDTPETDAAFAKRPDSPALCIDELLKCSSKLERELSAARERIAEVERSRELNAAAAQVAFDQRDEARERIAELVDVLEMIGCQNHAGNRTCNSCSCGSHGNTVAHSKCIVCAALAAAQGENSDG